MINSRRSVRTFLEGNIDDNTINSILITAMSAPSAGDSREWRFIVIKDKDTLTKLSEISKYSSFGKYANLGIVVCADLAAEKFKGFWEQDCGACAQNILLAATSLGLGSCWTAIYGFDDYVKAYKDFFELPENIIPFCFIPIGKTDQIQEPINRFDGSKVHLEKW